MARASASIVALGLLFFASLAGCDDKPQSPPPQQVVLYTAVDEPVARPIVAEFEKRTGIKVILQTDAETTKTAGLAQRLEAERGRPRADVWWSNEIFHTIRLAEAGVLAVYQSPSAEKIPPMFRDAKHRWSATALRARVIAVHTGADREPVVNSLLDLARPEFKGRICMAIPSAGTTRGHMAALYAAWGRERFEKYLRDLRANEIALLGGNSVVAEYVGKGQMLAGLTDNDDVDAMLRERGKLRMVLPDQREGEIGALMIPCSAALVAGGPNGEAGRKLLDYLLSVEVEKKMIDTKFARYSVFDQTLRPTRVMEVDYAKAAAVMQEATELALRVLQGRE